MAIKNDHYTYRVTWSAEDNEYVGLCAEFPSLSWLAKEPEAALKGIRDLLADVVNDMAENQEEIPEPFASKKKARSFRETLPFLGDEIYLN